MTGHRISAEQRSNLFAKIRSLMVAEITDQDKDLLFDLLHTEPLLKALGQVLALANELPMQILGVDLTDPETRNAAIQCQGQFQGYINSLEVLFDLIALPEEE